MNEDYLRKVALNFKSLLSVKYNIVLGKRGKSTRLLLSFKEENFFHLAGLHKIKGSHLTKLPKSRVFYDILDGKITYSSIEGKNGEFEVQARLPILEGLENFLDNDSTKFFKFERQRCNFFTRINANYLAKITDEDRGISFAFFVQEKNKSFVDVFDVCLLNSIFPLDKKDYSDRQCAYSVLFKEKIYDDHRIILFQHEKFNF